MDSTAFIIIPIKCTVVPETRKNLDVQSEEYHDVERGNRFLKACWDLFKLRPHGNHAVEIKDEDGNLVRPQNRYQSTVASKSYFQEPARISWADFKLPTPGNRAIKIKDESGNVVSPQNRHQNTMTPTSYLEEATCTSWADFKLPTPGNHAIDIKDEDGNLVKPRSKQQSAMTSTSYFEEAAFTSSASSPSLSSNMAVYWSSYSPGSSCTTDSWMFEEDPSPVPLEYEVPGFQWI